jgi:hypothetical protein
MIFPRLQHGFYTSLDQIQEKHFPSKRLNLLEKQINSLLSRATKTKTKLIKDNSNILTGEISIKTEKGSYIGEGIEIAVKNFYQK